MAAIELRNIRKAISGNQILAGVSLTIKDGEFVTLLGASGSGKSTILRTIAGLDQQDGGSILLDGRPIDDLGPADRNMAMVFQHYALYPHMTVRDNISLPLRARRMNWRQRLPAARLLSQSVRHQLDEIGAEVHRVAALLGLADLLDRRPRQLSGGQRQRVAMARAMVRQPSAFLMDEPLSNLDASLRQSIRAEIVSLQKTLGATFVYVTHDQTEAMTMSDRIALLSHGRLLQVGTPDELYNTPENVEVARFIGTPKINLIAGRTDNFGSIRLQGLSFPIGFYPAGLSVTVGIRPEDVQLSTAEHKRFLQGRVQTVEFLGNEIHVWVEIEAGLRLIARQPKQGSSLFRAGCVVSVGFAHERALVFAEDGRRLSPIQHPVACMGA